MFWGDVALGAGNAIALNSCGEWSFWGSRFKYYRINGVKMEWSPGRIVGGGTQREWKDMHIASWEDSTTYPLTDFSPVNLRQRPDYKVQNSARTYKKYVNVRKYQRKLAGNHKQETDSSFTGAVT